jgi:hypothetical protein
MAYLTVRGGLLGFALKTRDGGVGGGVPWQNMTYKFLFFFYKKWKFPPLKKIFLLYFFQFFPLIPSFIPFTIYLSTSRFPYTLLL